VDRKQLVYGSRYGPLELDVPGTIVNEAISRRRYGTAEYVTSTGFFWPCQLCGFSGSLVRMKKGYYSQLCGRSVILLFATILLHAWINNPIQLQGTLQELKRRHVYNTSTINIVSPLSITMLSIIMVAQMFFVWKTFLNLDEADMELDDIPVARSA